MNNKQRATLRRIFHTPTPGDILWTDIVSLFGALGGAIQQGRGSRVRVTIKGEDAIFHEPHPQRQTPREQLRAVRRFLERAGVKPS